MAEIKFNPLQPGKLCPFDSNDWETMKKKWNCQDPEFYHCMPNQYNQPGEICIKPNWASKNYCPIFNTAASDTDLIPCDLQYGACPDKDYRSNMVYKYAGCLNKTHIIKETTTESTDADTPLELHIIIPAAAISAVLLLIFLTIIGVVIYCRRCKGDDANDVELQHLLPPDTVTLSVRKTIDYLENGVFCKTKSYVAAMSSLKLHDRITLIGPQGSGKTLMAVQLARQLCGNKTKSRIFFCKTLQEITTKPYLKDEYMYVIMDDWLDHFLYYPSKVNEDTKLFDEILEVVLEYKKVRIIFTVQEDRWNAYGQQLSSHELFCSKSCVSIAIDKKSFTQGIVQGMVKNHLKYHETSIQMNPEEETLSNKKMDELNEKIKQAIAKNLKSDKEFSLPLAIDLICANVSFLMPSKTFLFKNGLSKGLRSFLQDWMTDKSEEEKRSFCILIFAALRGGKIEMTDFTSEVVRPIYENICKEYGLERREDIESIEGLLRQNQRLKGCLYQENDFCIIRHDSLLCFVLQFLIETKNSNVLIKNANMEVLLQRCWIRKPILKCYNDSKEGKILSEPAGAVIIPKDALKNLAERIHEEVIKGYFIPDWSDHIFMRHESFSKMWEEVHKKSATSDSMIGNQPKSEKNVLNITYESTSNIKNEETSKGMENYGDELATGGDPSPKGHKKNRRHNDKTNKSRSEDQASIEKRDSSTKKSHNKDESTEQKNKIPDLIEVNSPRNDVNPNKHAENSKTKKNRNKTKTKPKRQVENKNECVEETTQQSKDSSSLTIGDTPV